MTATSESAPPPPLIVYTSPTRHVSVIRSRRAMSLPDGREVHAGQLVSMMPEDLDQLDPGDYILIS